MLVDLALRIEGATPPRGQVVGPDGVSHPFVGWLALIRLLDAEAEESADPAEPAE